MNESEKREIEERKKILFINQNLGQDILNLLEDDLITEISANQDGRIWIDIVGKGYEKTEIVYSEIKRKTIIEVIASFNGKSANNMTPIISATLPNGERFEGILGEPVNNQPIFSIRKPSKVIIPLENFLTINKNEVVKDNTYEELKQIKEIPKLLSYIIEKRMNILVIGGTSSGKTSLTNACIQTLNNTKNRVITIEDTRELNCDGIENKVMLKTTEYVSARQLLRSTMRLNPDRILIGELRTGEESIELLKAWNSGHSGGMSTIHANNSQAGLQKLEQYLGEVSHKEQEKMILEAVNIVINIAKEGHKRGIKEIALVKSYDYENKQYILEKLL